MHFHLPKPMHGWREFVGEVGIIVIGVLIALGAEQVVVAFQTRANVEAFRETINHEIGLNLFMYDLRARQLGCETERVAALRKWLDQTRSRALVPAIIARSPNSITPYRSAWDNRNAEVFNHLPARVRQKYAEFYDELANNWSIMSSEKQDWGHLASYSEEGPITLADRRTIGPIIGRIADDNLALASNFRFSRDIAEVLKVKAVAPDNTPAEWLRHIADCPSVIAVSGTNVRSPARSDV